MEDFKTLPKMQHFKTGGSVVKKMCYGGKMKKGGKVEHDDIAEDKKLIKKAFKMHDVQEHKGEHTDLSKLKKGGRSKKEVGSVRKYKTGGSVENAYGAKKTDKDIDDIANTKRQKPAKLCMGKSVKKYADGRSVISDAKDVVLGTPAQNAQASQNEAKYLRAKQLQEAAGKPMSMGEKMAMGLATLGQKLQPAGKRRGGKVC